MVACDCLMIDGPEQKWKTLVYMLPDRIHGFHCASEYIMSKQMAPISVQPMTLPSD